MTRKSKRPERTETDQSLLREREKTDREIARISPKIEAAADEVLEVARQRAEEMLEVARDRADATLEHAAAPTTAVDAVARARSSEDSTLENERRIAAEVLEAEREARSRALRELLGLEREETDERLELERIRADDVVASRDDFLGMVSHDLRNLLGGIALSASVVLKRTADEPTKNEAARIQRYTAKMTRLVGDLVDAVSMEAGRLSIIPKPQDAEGLLHDVVETFRGLAAPKGITITLQPLPPLEPVSMDVERIHQVLTNLLSNALKFTPRGGAVEVVAAPAGDQVRFSVHDTGPGIDPESSTKIFDRFWQSAPGDRRGLGLGLYISRNIVEAHGGKIWFEPRKGGGSSFHFTLPVA